MDDEKGETNEDYIPNPPYSAFIDTIFKKSAGKLVLNAKVEEIDYSKK